MDSSVINQYRETHELTQVEMAHRLGLSSRHYKRIEAGELAVSERVRAAFNRLASQGVPKPVGDPAFSFIDLFAGIGGFRMGFEAAGGRCVFTSEWNRFAVKTYRSNFGIDHVIAGDITNVDHRLIPPHDVLLAGFPCQPFSIAGVSKKNSLGQAHGFDDPTQGTLFFDIRRILMAKRPRAFVLENVKNLTSHDGGQTFGVIMDTLTKKLGYSVSYKIIDARSFVPQHRERIFIVGFDEKTDFDFDFDVHLPATSPPTMAQVLHTPDELAEEPYTVGQPSQVNEKYTLSDKLWDYLQRYAEKHRAKGNGFGFGMVGPNDVARTLSARYYKDGSEILVAQEGCNPRRLTPRECARLMGFDDRDSKREFRIPVSDTQAYKQFGNAVAVPVVRAIAEGIAPYLHDARRAERSQIDLRIAGD